MSDRPTIPGKFVWFELVSSAPKEAQAFYGEVFGWTVRPLSTPNGSYEMIAVGDTTIGGFASPENTSEPSRWVSYASVADVDAAVERVTASGGRIRTPPLDLPGIGRAAGIVDPQGAELWIFKNDQGDPVDVDSLPPGNFCWNELHTPDPVNALSFYERALGYSHRGIDMGSAGTYYIVSQTGHDRGGVTHHLPPGAPPHWLPYVYVEDADQTVERASKLGAAIPMPCEDIPGVGRFGILKDPTGAVIAFLKPLPRKKQS